MEVDGDIHLRPAGFPQGCKALRCLIDEALRLNDPRRARLGHAGFEGGESEGDPILEGLRIVANVFIQADALAGRATKQLVDRYAQGLASQIP